MQRNRMHRESARTQPEPVAGIPATPEQAFDLLQQLLEVKAGEPVALSICGITAAGLYLYQANVDKRASCRAFRKLATELESAE